MEPRARALTQKLGKEFIEILEKATEEFLEVEGRQTALEEDVKMPGRSTQGIAAEEISLLPHVSPQRNTARSKSNQKAY